MRENIDSTPSVCYNQLESWRENNLNSFEWYRICRFTFDWLRRKLVYFSKRMVLGWCNAGNFHNFFLWMIIAWWWLKKASPTRLGSDSLTHLQRPEWRKAILKAKNHTLTCGEQVRIRDTDHSRTVYYQSLLMFYRSATNVWPKWSKRRIGAIMPRNKYFLNILWKYFGAVCIICIDVENPLMRDEYNLHE